MSRDDWPIPDVLRVEYQRLGREFLVEFLEVERGLRPRNLDALVELGRLYTLLGRYEEGLEVDRQLVSELPDNATVHYNLACSLALLGRGDEAIASLERSVELGFDDLELLHEDDDLASLREHPDFRALLRVLGDRDG